MKLRFVMFRNTDMFLSTQIPKLTEGREYIMRISAENMYGISDPLESEEMRAKDLFSMFRESSISLNHCAKITKRNKLISPSFKPSHKCFLFKVHLSKFSSYCDNVEHHAFI